MGIKKYTQTLHFDGGKYMEYTSYEVYECPMKPTEYGKYIGKTPIYEQALNACRNAKEHGKSYFIKGIKSDGTKVLII